MEGPAVAELSEVVEVNISQQTQAVSQAGFGVPLVLGVHTRFAERIRFYTSIDGMAGDGFLTADDEYKAASAMFAQTPSPSRIAIGRREANVAKVMTITLDADLITGNTIAATVNGSAVAQAFDTSHLNTMNAFAAAIDAVEGVASAVVGGVGNRIITVTAEPGYELSITGASVSGGASQAGVTLATTTAGKTAASELDLVVAASNDWYALLLTSRLDADQLTAAAWTEPRRKILLVLVDEAAAYAATTTDVGAKLEDKTYHRTAWAYHHAPAEFMEAAWAGAVLPLDPGSETWAYKTLAGVAASTLTTTQSQNVRTLKKGNTYETMAGVNITRDGQMASGRFIDQTRFIDWLEARLQEGVFALLIANPKIPYTDNGVSLVEAKVREVLAAGVAAGGIDPDSITVTVPRVASINVNDRAARILPGVKFSCRLSGAIHKITINGTVTV